MNEIADILDNMDLIPHVLTDALIESGYSGQAMSAFRNNYNLENMDIEIEDLYGIHKSFFNDIKTREDILEYEDFIKNMPTAFDENPYPLFHSFADGMYTREIHFNKGDFIVGAIHKKEYFVNVLKGRIWVVSEFGAKEIIAPASFKAKAGVKHIGFILEDTVWSDTHNIESDNIEDAEKEIFVDSYAELDDYNNIINGSFQNMCKKLGMTAQEVKNLSEIDENFAESSDHIEIKKSSIEGLGVFVTCDIKKGEIIALARIKDKRTMAGRYTNHSDSPNAIGDIDGDRGIFVALEDIDKGAEITADYINIREKSLLLDRSTLCLDG